MAERSLAYPSELLGKSSPQAPPPWYRRSLKPSNQIERQNREIRDSPPSISVKTRGRNSKPYNLPVLVSDFHYDLPPGLIAQEPLADRAGSRMLHLTRASGKWRDRTFREFPDLLRPDYRSCSRGR